MNIASVYLKWFLLSTIYIAVTLIFRMVNNRLQKKRQTIKGIIIFDAVKIILSITFAAISMGVDLRFSWSLANTFCIFSFIFLAEVAADIILGIVYLILSKNKKIEMPFKGKGYTVRIIASIFAIILLFVYGTTNATNVRRVETTFYSEKLTREHTFAFISDVHAGASQTHKDFEKVVERIEIDKPDFVILCGDITDEYTTIDEMKETYAILSKLSMPVYFVYGNHDEQNKANIAKGTQYTKDELVQTIEEAGIVILDEEMCMVDDEICLLGRSDSSRKERTTIKELIGYDKKNFLLVADHQPGNIQDSVDLNADLQVSGHTHGGQLFPLSNLMSLFTAFKAGDYKFESTLLYISNGESGWGYPFRTSGYPAYEIIHLKY